MARKARKTEAKVVIDDNTVDESVSTQADAVAENVVSDTRLEEETIGHSLCGGVLQAHRSEQGLSVNEVAKQLRLSVKQIEALEKDDFAALPESTIVKGFIRNYAKLLKIPSQPLTQAYMEMAPVQENYAFALDPGINRKISEESAKSYVSYYVLALIMLLGLGVWFFYQSYIQKPNPVTPMPEVAEALPELALPMAERANPSSTVIEMPSQQEVGEREAGESVPLEQAGNSATVTQDVSDDVGKPQEIEEEQLTESEASAKPPGNLAASEQTSDNQEPVVPGKRRIVFSATQETWVSVVNANGKEVYNKILYPGHRDTVDVWKPTEIVVGNAHGATLTVDGETIDLAPYTRINVARVRLNR